MVLVRAYRGRNPGLDGTADLLSVFQVEVSTVILQGEV